MAITLKEHVQFVEGEKDCRAGKDAKEGMSDFYYRGYSAQYDLEQRNTAMTEIMENRKWT
tara:strand:+ start:310 stop:489 length:180 start_codon:yes stop_codon:yes gene_type:complete